VREKAIVYSVGHGTRRQGWRPDRRAHQRALGPREPDVRGPSLMA
jgi:hypothetical protein